MKNNVSAIDNYREWSKKPRAIIKNFYKDAFNEYLRSSDEGSRPIILYGCSLSEKRRFFNYFNKEISSHNKKVKKKKEGKIFDRRLLFINLNKNSLEEITHNSPYEVKIFFVNNKRLEKYNKIPSKEPVYYFIDVSYFRKENDLWSKPLELSMDEWIKIVDKKRKAEDKIKFPSLFRREPRLLGEDKRQELSFVL